ncbi:MAG: hypothetical protein KGK10_10905 [Rhodospirillales bacterium]|nr:hypothetical protein [Rhodospirillales bacterium]
MLDIATFDARAGGSVLYKALAHPLAAEALAALGERLAGREVALVDPEGYGSALVALAPRALPIASVHVQDVQRIGQTVAGHAAQALTDLAAQGARDILIASFDAGRLVAQLRRLLPEARIETLDAIKLPAAMLSAPRYLDRLNFATNFAFFRDADGLSTRLVSANYWAGYGAGAVRLWLRLFDAGGRVLATWEEAVPSAGFAIDSAEVRARFGLGPFTGQLFLHVVGAAGHDVVKYALDTYGAGPGASLSCTHDANAWPADRYAGIPAPAPGERVVLWLQNSHATPIPAGAISFDRMGTERPVPYPHDVAGFGSVAVDMETLLPGLAWPAQIEMRAGRHTVRPRYEVVRAGRTRIAHPNVERADLRPDPAILDLPEALGRGFLLPLPVLPRTRFRTLIQPTPMATTQQAQPLRLDVFAADGTLAASHVIGVLPRNHDVALDLDAILPAGALAEGGHAELLYARGIGGAADGWLHALVRAEAREGGHAAESSFGAHIFNTLMTWRDEPQSYSGPPPGLSTRLFLKLGMQLGDARAKSFALLIYPASAPWHGSSETSLQLVAGNGAVVAQAPLAIRCSGSALVVAEDVFSPAQIATAGPRGYVLVRDTTCRLFGYHGLMTEDGRFSLDHMFGF